MRHLANLNEASAKRAWLTIGVFDGVHVGHQTLIRDLAAAARQQGAVAVVLTFHPHPVEVLRGPVRSFYLSTPEEKAALIKPLGADLLITHLFDQMTAETSARRFVLELRERLGLEQLWVGADFALGHNREGTVPVLRVLGEELGFKVKTITAVESEGGVVSSSRIRTLLADGDVSAAARLLGRNYKLSGAVVDGAKRGRSIGIPTANLALDEKRAIPATGVYVTRAHVAGRSWGAVTNIGVRPTFEDGTPAPIVETHILDYDGGEFYDQTLGVEFIARLRAEQKFSGIDALVAQIQKDISAARSLLSGRL